MPPVYYDESSPKLRDQHPLLVGGLVVGGLITVISVIATLALLSSIYPIAVTVVIGSIPLTWFIGYTTKKLLVKDD